MPLYTMRNILEARGVKAFLSLEAGVTRGILPEQPQTRKLQQELQKARREIVARDQKLARLQEQSAGKGSKDRSRPENTSIKIATPPEDIGAVAQAGDADRYLRFGQNIKDALLRYTDVTPTSSILDIGAGPGRVASAFVDYVEPPGRYVGMDVEKTNMDWCEENISPANPAFSFLHQDIYNGMYNPQGRYKASEYRFPFEDSSFDLVILTSVFTHLVPEDTLNYLREISRLLKPDGTCFCTWFLLGHDLNVKYMGPRSREARVGYGFRQCLEMLEKSGLTLAKEPALGSWRGQTAPARDQNPVGNQDLLLLRRNSNGEASLLSRYRAPDLSNRDHAEFDEVNGTIQQFNPVSSSITIWDGGEEKTFRVLAEAELWINGQRTDSALLRSGQEATVQFVRDRQTDTDIAQAIYVTDHPRMERVAGTVEAIDWERGLITLIVGNSVKTLQFDLQSLRVIFGREQRDVGELNVGQGVSIEQIPGAKTIRVLG